MIRSPRSTRISGLHRRRIGQLEIHPGHQADTITTPLPGVRSIQVPRSHRDWLAGEVSGIAGRRRGRPGARCEIAGVLGWTPKVPSMLACDGGEDWEQRGALKGADSLERRSTALNGIGVHLPLYASPGQSHCSVPFHTECSAVLRSSRQQSMLPGRGLTAEMALRSALWQQERGRSSRLWSAGRRTQRGDEEVYGEVAGDEPTSCSGSRISRCGGGTACLASADAG
jgi:hypothetical protein